MKKIYSSFALLALLGTSAQAFDYKVGGSVEFFSKVGFNQKQIDVANSIYPTDTWGSIVGSAYIDMDFLTQEQKDLGNSLTGGFGIMAGGLVFDNTKDASGNPYYKLGFFGDSTSGAGNSVVAQEYITTNFVIYNAYLDYVKKTNDHRVEIKVGRYNSKAQFMSGSTQGFEIDYQYKGLNLWWFSSYGRGFGYSQWMYDFYAPKKHGNANYGIHAFKPSYTFDSGLYISPFVYFSPDFYIAPMLELGFDSNPNFNQEGFRSQTTIFFMAPYHLENAQNDYRYQFVAGKNGQTLAIKQRFDYNNFNFGAGWYQNFGNANAHIGTYGNAMVGPWDFWTNTVYDFGALSNAVTKDAKTGYIFVGASHGKFSWDILGRMTFSTRGDEQAIPLNLTYNFTQNCKIWLKLEWQNVTLHKGYVINDGTSINPDSTKPINEKDEGGLTSASWSDYQTKKSISSDRSHAMINISYSF